MKYKNKSNFLPTVKFYKNKFFFNHDLRRSILGVYGDFGLPLQIKQIKIIDFSDRPKNSKNVIGNHSHDGNSNQWEIIIVLGNENSTQIDFRYRNYDQKEVKKKLLYCGDVVVIPPGCSLGLIPLNSNVKLIEISNEIYDAKNYIIDKLF